MDFENRGAFKTILIHIFTLLTKKEKEPKRKKNYGYYYGIISGLYYGIYFSSDDCGFLAELLVMASEF